MPIPRPGMGGQMVIETMWKKILEKLTETDPTLMSILSNKCALMAVNEYYVYILMPDTPFAVEIMLNIVIVMCLFVGVALMGLGL